MTVKLSESFTSTASKRDILWSIKSDYFNRVQQKKTANIEYTYIYIRIFEFSNIRRILKLKTIYKFNFGVEIAKNLGRTSFTQQQKTDHRCLSVACQ